MPAYIESKELEINDKELKKYTEEYLITLNMVTEGIKPNLVLVTCDSERTKFNVGIGQSMGGEVGRSQTLYLFPEPVDEKVARRIYDDFDLKYLYKHFLSKFI